MKITDETLIVKYKTMGWRNADIAKKLGVTEEQIEQKWRHLEMDIQGADESGFGKFCDLFTTMAAQYQLLGASLAQVGGQLSRLMSTEELEKLIVKGDPKATLANLRKHCIVLHAYKPIPPEELLKLTSQGN